MRRFKRCHLTVVNVLWIELVRWTVTARKIHHHISARRKIAQPRVTRTGSESSPVSSSKAAAAKGARLVTTATYELARRQGRYALCTMCIGVGQGIAVILERV